MKGRERKIFQPLFAVVCLLLVSDALLAVQKTGIPSSVCTNDYYQCDSQANARWSLFQDSEGIEPNQKPFMSVGSCSRNGKSRDEVFMLLALSHHSNRIFFNGKIGFFDNFSEYRDATASHIPTVFPDIHNSQNTMSLSDSHAYIDFTDSAPTRYWLRHNPEHGRYVMVIYFGFTDTLLCEFQSA